MPRIGRRDAGLDAALASIGSMTPAEHAAMMLLADAAPAQAAPNPNPNVGSEANCAVSEVSAANDPLEDAGESRVQPLVPAPVGRLSAACGRRLTVAARKGDAEEMARLLTLKPNVNFRDTDGITPLQAACQVGMDG